MPALVSPNEIAATLGVHATGVRRWLRQLAEEGHPSVPDHRLYERWTFSPEDAAQLVRLFRLQHRSMSRRQPTGQDMIVRFQGSEPLYVDFEDFIAFLDAIYRIYRLNADSGVFARAPSRPSLQRVVAGSPVDIQWVFEGARDVPGLAATIGLALLPLVTVLNNVLTGRATRRKLDAQTFAIRERGARQSPSRRSQGKGR